MSSLLPNLQRYLRASHESRQVVRSPSFDEQAGFAQVEAKLSEAELLEAPMAALPVGSCSVAENQFNYFMDGIQRSWLLYYQNFVPVYYGYTAAVVRQRQEAVLSKWNYVNREALYLPFGQFDPEELDRLRSQQLPLQNSESDSSLASTPQTMLDREKARNAITLSRERLEVDLAQQWINSDRHGWLVMDGSITTSQATAEHPRVVGLIKSHNTQYFQFPEQSVILNLQVGERSSTFSPPSRHQVCSWYLRLRDQTNQDIHFGLIRVEASLKSIKKDRGLCDRLSQWIMTERRPLSLPDARWDKMIYPIRDCEQYLRSLEPSRAWLG